MSIIFPNDYDRYYILDVVTNFKINLRDCMLLMERYGVNGSQVVTRQKYERVSDTSFRHVRFRETDFIFGPIQSIILQELYKAGQSGYPWQNGKILLRKAGSGSFNLRSVFSRHPAWGILVISDRRGLYRLSEDFVKQS